MCLHFLIKCLNNLVKALREFSDKHNMERPSNVADIYCNGIYQYDFESRLYNNPFIMGNKRLGSPIDHYRERKGSRTDDAKDDTSREIMFTNEYSRSPGRSRSTNTTGHSQPDEKKCTLVRTTFVAALADRIKQRSRSASRVALGSVSASSSRSTSPAPKQKEKKKTAKQPELYYEDSTQSRTDDAKDDTSREIMFTNEYSRSPG